MAWTKIWLRLVASKTMVLMISMQCLKKTLLWALARGAADMTEEIDVASKTQILAVGKEVPVSDEVHVHFIAGVFYGVQGVPDRSKVATSKLEGHRVKDWEMMRKV